LKSKAEDSTEREGFSIINDNDEDESEDLAHNNQSMMDVPPS
jgi:hypothetical protein